MKTYFIGWDVGAWYCDKNTKSRDALYIIDDKGNYRGEFRGNLKNGKPGKLGGILEESSSKYFIQKCFDLCQTNLKFSGKAILAIDAPLGFPSPLITLLTKNKFSETVNDNFRENDYLFRYTEQKLNADNSNYKPLSTINHMIGAQSTKAIHLIAKLGLKNNKKGVWENENLTVLETYPAIARTKHADEMRVRKTSDVDDAQICAEVAVQFFEDLNRSYDPNRLNYPDEKTDDMIRIASEGWIFY